MPVLIPNNEPRQIPLTFAAKDGSEAAPPASLTVTAAAGLVEVAYANGVLTITPGGGTGTDTIAIAGLEGTFQVTLTAPAAKVSFGDPVALAG